MTTRRFSRRTIFSSILGATALMGAAQAQACSPEPYIGSVCITAANFCPAKTHVEANGQILAISNYTTLFSLLGTTYGGNGTTTFAVPDMQGRTPVGAGAGPGLQTVPLGMRRGIDYLTLNDQQLPSHNHTATLSGDAVSVAASTSNATKGQAAAGDYIASNSSLGGTNIFISGSAPGATVPLGGVSGGSGSVEVQNNGGSQPFPNFPPQTALKYCIAVTGIYPSHP